MAGITKQIDDLTAQVKSELGVFLGNQETLLRLRTELDTMKADKPDVWAKLDASYNTLYSKQAVIETRAMAWMGNISTLKTNIMANPDIAAALSSGTISAAMFSSTFWKQVSAYTNQALPLINEGLAVASQLVGQNGDVTLLKNSIEQKVVLSPTTKTVLINSGLAWAYGLLGIGLAYAVATRKKNT